MRRILSLLLMWLISENMAAQFSFTSDSLICMDTFGGYKSSISKMEKVQAGGSSYSIIYCDPVEAPTSYLYVFNDCDSLRILESLPYQDLQYLSHGIHKMDWINFETCRGIVKKYLVPALKAKWSNYKGDTSDLVNFYFFFDMTGKLREVSFTYKNEIKNDLPIYLLDTISKELVNSNFGLTFNKKQKGLERANWLMLRYTFSLRELSK